jgi:hypothetical protein
MAFRLAPVTGDRVYGLLNIKLASLVVGGTSWMRPCSELLAAKLPADYCRHPLRLSFGPFGLIVLLSMMASAQQTPETKSPVTEIERYIFNYGDHDATCIRWTDKCRTCNRGASADIVCSNIGIACQPAEVECLERQQSDGKK